MKRAVEMFCAGLLLLEAGCVWQVGNTRVEADVKINQQSIDVAVDRAVEKLQQELQRRGLEVTVTPDGDAYRVVSKTRSGEQFTVILTRVRTAEGKEQTLVRVEWSTKPDRDLWLGLLAALVPVVVGAPR